MAKWKCEMCGCECEGENPPENCPQYHAPKELFMNTEE